MAAARDTLRRHTIRTTFVGRLPGAVRHYQKYLPLMPLALIRLGRRLMRMTGDCCSRGRFFGRLAAAARGREESCIAYTVHYVVRRTVCNCG